jgi:hypothetical protein
MKNANFQLTSPLVTVEQYSIMTGESIGVIQGHVNKRLLPCKKIGKRIYINLVQLTNQLAGE